MTPEEIKKLQDDLKASLDANTALTARIAESEKATRKAAAKAEVEKQLNESTLPDAAKDRLRKQFAESEDATPLTEAIKAEEAYIKSLGVKAPVKKNNGQSNNETGETDMAKIQEAQVASYRGMGLSEAEAKIAAGIR